MSAETKTLNKKIGQATRWSAVTEVCAKLVAPISSMILARLLTPEAFGVVATFNVIISFTDMFTDAGFQKYLVQHEFSSDTDREESTTVAFWTNLIISLVLWGIIILFRHPLAAMVGNPDKGNVLAIACIVLPMTSFSSIQMAVLKRDFDFRSLFFARIIGVCIPIFITVPSAFWLRSYWALIIGTIARHISDAVVLTIRSPWKPRIFYSVRKLREMISFSLWTLMEQIAIWLTSYIGTFIVGVYLTSHYVGLYKTAMATVTQFTTLITSATTPVLFSALSRLQDEKQRFEETFLHFQRMVSLLIVPMCLCIFMYRDLVTKILLGEQWMEASMFIGLWGLTSGLGILLNNYCSEAYRALGKPKISLAVQVLHLLFLVPALLLAAKEGFVPLYWTRSMIRFQLYITQLIVLYVVTRISVLKIAKNIAPAILAGCAALVAAIALQRAGSSILWDTISIGICGVIYIGTLLLIPSVRKELFLLIVPKLPKKLTAKLPHHPKGGQVFEKEW